MMRIIAGTARRRPLETLDGDDITRPQPLKRSRTRLPSNSNCIALKSPSFTLSAVGRVISSP